MIRYLVFSIAIFWKTSIALAANPCTPLPCKPDSDNGDGECIARADWIVEGKVIEVIHGEKEVCESLYGCGKVWNGIGVVIENAKSIKGNFPIGNHRITFVIPGSHCWKYETYIPEEKIGARFKFFGLNESYGYWARSVPGYFLSREIEDAK